MVLSNLSASKNSYKLAAHGPFSTRDYLKQTCYIASIDSFCTMNKKDNSYNLFTHESILIQRDKPIFNSQKASISNILFQSCCFSPVDCLQLCLLVYCLHDAFSYGAF